MQKIVQIKERHGLKVVKNRKKKCSTKIYVKLKRDQIQSFHFT